MGYDFVVIDQEHAAFNRESTDHIILACRASGLGCLVRVQNGDPACILSVLDCGADGVLVPHVTTAKKAQEIVSAARYNSGSRGYSPTTRAGNFGSKSIAQHLQDEDARALVIAMIEDPEAVEDISEIVATPGLDGVFIGRGDLTVAYSEVKPGSAPVKAATMRIVEAATAANVAICAMSGSVADADTLADMGVTAFIVASDQTLLRDAAKAQLQDFQNSFLKQRDRTDGL
ncbi:HpcH/HpaI aldolase family protein [Parasedimentitalea marina]|uniref:HpcH/HpaI aldolase family protein n=1 Tax=Parasedimentitalea marina TaxID=2483033 RepID=UPI0013E33808|nr:aldolase/citrate lyase family protein [Parasedimentitalea marina]